MLRFYKEKFHHRNGFTIIELLIVAAVISILLMIALPNLIKARMSANEANARKAMQTLRDAEAEFFEQDLNNSGSRDYTDQIGNSATQNTLRCPADPPGSTCTTVDELVDGSFTEADINNGGAGGMGLGSGDGCNDPKAGYCIVADFTGMNQLITSAGITYDDFGWEASMTTSHKTGRKDFSIYGDGVIRCTTSTQPVGSPGIFESMRTVVACD